MVVPNKSYSLFRPEISGKALLYCLRGMEQTDETSHGFLAQGRFNIGFIFVSQV